MDARLQGLSPARLEFLLRHVYTAKPVRWIKIDVQVSSPRENLLCSLTAHVTNLTFTRLEALCLRLEVKPVRLEDSDDRVKCKPAARTSESSCCLNLDPGECVAVPLQLCFALPALCHAVDVYFSFEEAPEFLERIDSLFLSLLNCLPLETSLPPSGVEVRLGQRHEVISLNLPPSVVQAVRSPAREATSAVDLLALVGNGLCERTRVFLPRPDSPLLQVFEVEISVTPGKSGVRVELRVPGAMGSNSIAVVRRHLRFLFYAASARLLESPIVPGL